MFYRVLSYQINDIAKNWISGDIYASSQLARIKWARKIALLCISLLPAVLLKTICEKPMHLACSGLSYRKKIQFRPVSYYHTDAHYESRGIQSLWC
jgi:hypothetical protein